MCQRRKGLKLHHLESCALQIPEQEVHSSLTSLGKRRKKTVQWWCALLTHNPRCVTPTHNIPLEYFTMLQIQSSVKKKKKKIRAAYQLVPQKLGLIRQTKHKIQGCSEVKKWHWINIFFLKKKKAIYMQMMLLAFAVIAICARHPKRYNGNTFKLRGGTGRKACGQWAEIWGSWVVFRYIALSSLVTQFSSS